jgi:hypothetical protein
MAGLCLVFYEASKFFSRVVAPACIPPAVYKGSFFPTSSPTHVGCVFDDGYSNRGEVKSYCGFDLKKNLLVMNLK